MNMEWRTEIDAGAEALFSWHARPGAFERLVPPWESVRLVSPHPGISDGSRVTLAIRTGPFTSTWVARHEGVEPGRGFVDVQERGPFARWRHTHRFEPAAEGRSSLIDRLDCDLPGGPLGELAEPWLRRKLNRTFRYRHAVTRDDLALHGRWADQPRLVVAISGASGLIGSALAALLTSGGHRVVRLVRRPPRAGEIQWDPDAGQLAPDALAGVDAVVHLAGESIAGSRWSPAQQERIRSSRARGTETLARAIAAATPRPRVLVSASAVGLYGDRGADPLDETAVPGAGFLASVAQAWENAAAPARDAGVRTAFARFGIVLTPAGGALAQMLPPFKVGLGAPLGSGHQWMSWISLDDTIGALLHLLMSEVEGPVNVVAPEAVTNGDFTDALGHAVRRPTFLPPVPPFALRALVGGLADEGLLASTRVVPARLQATGYHFRHPTLELALSHVLGTSRRP